MKNLKKLISVLLAVCMMMGITSSYTVFATENEVSVFEDVSSDDNGEELIPLATARCKYTSVNQMQHLISSNQAPAGVIGAHHGFQGQQPHVHFSDGTAMNFDGSAHHGNPKPSSAIMKWLNSHGWCIKK